MIRAIQFAFAAFLALIVTMPALAQAADGGDYAEHLRALMERQHDREVERLERQLQRTDLHGATRQLMAKKLKLLRSEGQLALGYYGDLITVPSHVDFGSTEPPTAIVDKYGISVPGPIVE